MIDTYLVDNRAFILVEDNGGGIDMKKSKKIFNPYFTTKPAQSGTGLGLYILKLIVEDSMNGRVSVRNGEEGAIFTIEIPIN
jgi:signal transduction histidine kinase